MTATSPSGIKQLNLDWDQRKQHRIAKCSSCRHELALHTPEMLVNRMVQYCYDIVCWPAFWRPRLYLKHTVFFPGLFARLYIFEYYVEEKYTLGITGLDLAHVLPRTIIKYLTADFLGGNMCFPFFYEGRQLFLDEQASTLTHRSATAPCLSSTQSQGLQLSNNPNCSERMWLEMRKRVVKIGLCSIQYSCWA